MKYMNVDAFLAMASPVKSLFDQLEAGYTVDYPPRPDPSLFCEKQ